MKTALFKDTAGVILAGGASSRFGSNKALADLAGQPMIQYGVDLLNSLFKERLLVANTPEAYDFLGWKIVADIFPGAGPLAGIHAALTSLHSGRAFITACDMPFVNGRVVEFLCSLSGDWDVVLPWLENGPEPLYGVYRKSCLDVIGKNLQNDQRRIRVIFKELKVRRVGFDEIAPLCKVTTFSNINRISDMARLAFSSQNQVSSSTFVPSLAQAQKLILSHVTPTAQERVEFGEALGRFVSRPIRAQWPIPHFDQSAMDGFAVCNRDLPQKNGAESVCLVVSAELGAGCTDIPCLSPGQAIRIMTGAHLPFGADQVVPREKCRDHGGQVEIDSLADKGAHVRRAGCDVRKGRLILKKGSQVMPVHLQLMAGAGICEIQVHCRPRVAILATGSELVNKGPLPGQTISANPALLGGLIRQAGGIPVDLGLVPDQIAVINEKINLALESQVQVIITTGGMGPGKFDLIEHCFNEIGVEIFYRRLKIRPGKCTLFGRKDNVLFFGLPGPPPAVQTLFVELVKPALLHLQGHHSPKPQALRATLLREIISKKNGVLSLKGGIYAWQGGRLVVQPVSRGDAANSVILVPAHRRCLKKGEMVTVHPFYGMIGGV